MNVALHAKGERRLRLDAERRESGEPRDSRLRGSHTNRNSRYPKGGRAMRNRGRTRFKTGRKAR